VRKGLFWDEGWDHWRMWWLSCFCVEKDFRLMSAWPFVLGFEEICQLGDMKCKILSLESMTSYYLKRGKSEVTCWSMNLVEHHDAVHYRYIQLLVSTILNFYCLAHALLYSFYAFPLVRTSFISKGENVSCNLKYSC
jgi:hypothetical protein